MPLVDRAAVLGRQVRRVDDILDPDWKTVQRRRTDLARARLGNSPIGIDELPRLHLSLSSADPIETGAGQLLRADFPARKQGDGLGRRQLVERSQAFHHRRAICPYASTACPIRSTRQYSSVWCAISNSPGPSTTVGMPP